MRFRSARRRRRADGVLLIDGNCGFCKAWTAALCVGACESIAWQSLRHSLDQQVRNRLEREAGWLDDTGRIEYGNKAIVRALRASGGLRRILGAIIDLPLLRRLAAVVYRNVARNRYRLPAPPALCQTNPRHR